MKFNQSSKVFAISAMIVDQSEITWHLTCLTLVNQELYTVIHYDKYLYIEIGYRPTKSKILALSLPLLFIDDVVALGSFFTKYNMTGTRTI